MVGVKDWHQDPWSSVRPQVWPFNSWLHVQFTATHHNHTVWVHRLWKNHPTCFSRVRQKKGDCYSYFDVEFDFQSTLRPHALLQVLQPRRAHPQVQSEQGCPRLRDLLHRPPGGRQLVTDSQEPGAIYSFNQSYCIYSISYLLFYAMPIWYDFTICTWYFYVSLKDIIIICLSLARTRKYLVNRNFDAYDVIFSLSFLQALFNILLEFT